jgi:hypothetical protein
MELFGRKNAASGAGAEAQPADEQAIARYRYMLNTAPPEALEQAHAEAFARLSPEQRRLVLERLSENVPAAERASVEQGGASPQALARMATRAEIRQPGAMERMFGQRGGVGLGGMMAGSLLGSIAGTVLGSMIAREFFGNDSQGEDAGLADADPSMDAGEGFDGGGFDV